MNPAYLGDSYDVVKRFLCGMARSAGYAVYIDPMFTGDWTYQQRAAFFRFLGARALGASIPKSLAALLVDPDTGIRTGPGPAHVTFASIAGRCDQFALVFVFDQSFSRGENGLEAMKTKLTSLRALGIRGVYYDSHARFLVCSKSSARVMRFRKVLIQAGLPAARFFGIPASASKQVVPTARRWNW
jgi:hypothetical protein